jgi:site-specific DNA-methyltransferase (adenine-specific)
MKRRVGYIPRKEVSKNADLISTYKVLLPKAFNGGDAIPHQIVGKPELAPSPSVCTQSYIFLRLDSDRAARSAQSYYATRFFRFLVSLRKITQDALHSTFKWVPVQEWDHTWSDEQLYAKYGITRKERAYIESQVKVMNVDDGGDE